MTQTSLKSTATADKASLTTFLNSLFREWEGWRLRDGGTIVIDLDAGESLHFPLSYYSLLGRHDYNWPPVLHHAGGPIEELDFRGCVEKIVEHLASSWTGSSRNTFIQRVLRSRSAVYDFLERKPELGRPVEDFRQSESHLFLGHSFHPCPKSRDGFSPEDHEIYSPEFAQEFPLQWWAVDPVIFFERQSAAFGTKDWIDELRRHEEDSGFRLPATPDGYRHFPLHPWQAEYLKSIPPVAEHLRKGRIAILGSTGKAWMSTSSVRSFHSWTAPYMLKTSLSVRLTNSLRNLLPPEVERGMQVHEVFSSPLGQDLLRRFPNFHVLYEAAYCGLKDAEGRIINESLLVCRSNPFGPKAAVTMLASLNQDDPDHEGTLLGWHLREAARKRQGDLREIGRSWFRQYCALVLKPLLIAQADYGILLGAHQQNILIGFENHFPSALYFRDCQGTGYSRTHAAELRRHIPSLDEDNGNILDNDMAHALLGYYLIINSSFNVIVSIAKAVAVPEDELVGELRDFLEGLRASGLRDSSLVDHLLESETLLHKGNFFCSFENINENTSKNPLAIYREIKNPIHRPFEERSSL